MSNILFGRYGNSCIFIEIAAFAVKFRDMPLFVLLGLVVKWPCIFLHGSMQMQLIQYPYPAGYLRACWMHVTGCMQIDSYPTLYCSTKITMQLIRHPYSRSLLPAAEEEVQEEEEEEEKEEEEATMTATKATAQVRSVFLSRMLWGCIDNIFIYIYTYICVYVALYVYRY
jgi:hypothetical protein